MRVYLFDYETRLYVGPCDLSDADRDPESPAQFLVPGDATPVPPPDCPSGYVPQWTGTEWIAIPDPPAPPAGCASTIARAAAAVAAADRIAIDCVKAGIPFPPAWRAYDAAARAVLARPETASDLPPTPARPVLTDY